MFQVRFEKVATPLASVVTTLVEPAVRVPVEVRVTETPGLCPNPSFLAGPAVTVIDPVVVVRRPATGSV